MRQIACLAALLAVACAPAPSGRATEGAAPLSAADVSAFPADASLMRAEDGVILDDGRIVVADQAHGLRAVKPDGSSAPFGRFAEAGYAHGAIPAGPNGVSFTPDRAHILVADIYTGAIWRVSVADERAEKLFQHAFGVNTATADETGAVWFTQSAANAPGPASEAAMFDAIDKSRADGKLYRLSTDGKATVMASGLAFANGIAIDPARNRLYMAETMADRIVVFTLDAQDGSLSERRVLATVIAPDNVKIGRDGAVFVASPALNGLMVVDPDSGAARTFFRAAGPGNEAALEAWTKGREAGAGVVAAVTPQMWAPLPGAVTSVILNADGAPAYLGTLGPALVKFDAPAQ